MARDLDLKQCQLELDLWNVNLDADALRVEFGEIKPQFESS